MDLKTKAMIVGGGVIAVLAVTGLKRGNAVDSDQNKPNSVSINSAMASYMSSTARNAADIMINKDNVTGATTIQQLRTIQSLAASNNDLSAKIIQSQAGVENAKITSRTAAAIESMRASVAKTIAKQQASAAKHASDNTMIASIAGGAIKGAASIISSIF